MQQVETGTASPPIAPPFVISPATTIQKTNKQPKKETFYPESDSKPMADNSIQFSYITALKGNFDILYKHDPDVFIAGDMLWYPVEGHNEITNAPDVMVILGRPKRDRGSYKQWEEDNIPPQVVFEIWSPSNKKSEKDAKFAFYNRHGVEEYYAYDPKNGKLEGWVRQQGQLVMISDMQNWKSPLLSVKFVVEGKELKLRYPDGHPFLSYIELDQRWHQEALARKSAEELAQKEIEARKAAENKAKREAQARAKEAQARAKETQARLIAEEKAKQSEELVRQLQEQLKKAQASK